MMKYFSGSFLFALIGLVASAGVGYYYGGTAGAAAQALFTAFVLSILEISLSFDNAIVNAIVLKEMTPLWRHRFLTWGMVIAVFGMRLIFPLMIVTFVSGVNPWDALVMAATSPDQYAQIMLSAHANVAAFGGMFLMMVALKYFYDEHKDEHWIHWLEAPVAKLGKLEAFEIFVSLSVLLFVASRIPSSETASFIKSGLFGLMTYILVDGISGFLEMPQEGKRDLQKASAGMFIYLEVLDASFSFDGVVGAFAITHNLFIIMIGLSIGAFFVRSLTIMFVEKEALNKYVYLEHGAFYAIGALATLMILDPVFHIPEWVTGLVGAVFIIASFMASLKAKANGKAKA